MTEQVLREAVGLDSFNRALLFSQVAKIWRDEDPNRARSYMKRAIQEIASRPNRETVSERAKRLGAARALIPVAVLIDREFVEQLDSILTANRNEQSAEQRDATASALVQGALAILEKDPARAAAMGSMSLSLGRSPQVIYLVSLLRTRDQELADTLFLEVLASALRSLDIDILASLARVAFIGPSQTASIQQAVLIALHELIGRLSSEVNSGDALCRLAKIATPLLGQFKTLLPQSLDLVQAAVLRCGNSPNPFRETSTGSAFDSKLRSVDDFLRAAGETSNPERRVFLMSRAAYIASQEKNYDRAVSILDQFSDSERAEMEGTWENWRWEFASSAAVERLKQNDVATVDKILYSTPTSLRAFVAISVVRQMETRHKQKAMELLQDARRSLKNTDAVTLDWYLSLLRAYLTFLPDDAPPVLREMVQAINRRDSHQTKISGIEADSNLEPIALPKSLLETDIIAVRSAVQETTVTDMRIRLMLGLISSSIELAKRNRSAASGI